MQNGRRAKNADKTLSKITSLRTAIIRSPAGGRKPKNFGRRISAYAERDDENVIFTDLLK
jgi:hypothetical protein